MPGVHKTIQILMERKAFLEKRIKDNPEKDLGFDRRERDALYVAIDFMASSFSVDLEVVGRSIRQFTNTAVVIPSEITCPSCGVKFNKNDAVRGSNSKV